MRIRHDGELTAVEGSYENMEQALLPLLQDQRVVVKMEIDGEAIPNEQLADLGQIQVADVEEICIETASIQDVALDGLASACEYATRVRVALCETAELMRSDRPEVANEHFAEAIDGMTILFFTLEAASRTLGESASSIQQIGGQIEPWLDAVVQAQEAQDWIRVADYLEYEIAPILDRAPDQIDATRRHCGLV